MAKNTDAPVNVPPATSQTVPDSAFLKDVNTHRGDVFQNALANAITWAEHNVRIIAALVVVAILGGIAYAGLQWVDHRQERAAQEAYYAAESRFAKVKEGFDRAKYKALMPEQDKADPSKTDATPATGDLAKDYGAVIGDLEKIARDFAGTTAGAQAGILVGETYVTYKQPEKAVEVAQLAATKLKPSETLQQLSNVLWGNALAAKDDCQGAVGIWQKVLSNSAAAHLHADVSLRSGLCFEKLGQNDKAIEMYRTASASAESAAGTTAKGFLRALEVKSQAPTPASAP